MNSLALASGICMFVGLPLLTAGQSSQPSKRNMSSPRTVVIDGTGEASLTQPRVFVQLKDGRQILTGESVEIPEFDITVEEGGATSFPAFLDTGAGSYVISQQTLDRFGARQDPDSVYYDVGLHGETAMSVTNPYALFLSGTNGRMGDAPRKFIPVQNDARFQIMQGSGNLMTQMMGAIDVIGMPAIQNFVVEIDLTALTDVGTDNDGDPLDLDDPGGLDQLLNMATDDIPIGPAVTLHGPRERMRDVDYVIPLDYRDYNRRKHPNNRGALPTLAKNPMIADVHSSVDGQTSIADWLLDTGAATSIISSRHALSLGLYNKDLTPKKEPSFSLPLAGVSGQMEMAPGYVLDSIKVKVNGGSVLEFRNVHVVVKDISVVLDDGSFVLLDGVFGMNLLFPSASGLGGGWPTDLGNAPFRKIWIDGPRGRLGLQKN